MVVFQDAEAHPLPAGDIFGRFDVIGMVRYFADKNNAGVFHDGVIGNAVAPDIISVFLQFADSFFFQPAAHCMPEFN